MTRNFTFIAAAIPILWLATALAAQPTSPAATRSERTVWDGVYTETQASRGLDNYERSCARCHALDASGVPERFTGNRFWTAWGEDTLDRLQRFIQESMPNDSPGSLSEETYVDITAFLLQANGIPPGQTELNATATRSIKVARRDSDGSLPDGAFVAVVGCLVKAKGGGWTITGATDPVRPRSADAEARVVQGGAQQSPGARMFDLLYVVTPLEQLVGHKVLVRGLLVRKPVDGINVTNVESVAANCPL